MDTGMIRGNATKRLYYNSVILQYCDISVSMGSPLSPIHWFRGPRGTIEWDTGYYLLAITCFGSKMSSVLNRGLHTPPQGLEPKCTRPYNTAAEIHIS